MKACLAAGYPFVFGFTVYESFESADVARTGVASMPAPDEKVIGGHAVLAVGYDDAAQTFLVRNSWGTGWGQAGYFTLPYAYFTTTRAVVRLLDDPHRQLISRGRAGIAVGGAMIPARSGRC